MILGQYSENEAKWSNDNLQTHLINKTIYAHDIWHENEGELAQFKDFSIWSWLARV